MATYEELTKFIDNYDQSQMQKNSSENAYDKMVRERYGSSVGTGKTTYNTNHHYIKGANFYYLIGIIIFICIFIKKDFNTALKICLYWCGFWALFSFILSLGKIGETVAVLGYAGFFIVSFICFALKK